ncbi:MAG: hypothetical protein GY866_29885 [Proteobacteria bacterium]|nr:hypothetical protein [Pseudomonadota bacterium]
MSFKAFVAVVVIFLIVVAAIIGYPYYRTYIAPWHMPVLTVGDRTFDRKYFMKHLRIRLAGVERNQQTIAIQLIGEIQNRELNRREAEKRGIRVTNEEVEKEIRVQVEKAASGEGDFTHLYDSMLRGLQLDPEDYEEIIRSALIEKKIADSFLSETPAETPQVFVKVIVTATAKKAQEIRTRLANGEGFSKVAREESIDLGSSKDGGELGWLPKGVWDLKATGLVHARGILTQTIEEAKQIRKRLEEGKRFSQLAKTYSLDAVSRDRGGYLGWVSTEYKKGKQFAAETYDLKPGRISRPIDTREGFWIIQMIETSPADNVFDDYVFQMPVGTVSPPFDTQQGFYLFQVIEKKDQWLLRDEFRRRLARNKMEMWLRKTTQKGNEENWIKWYWGSDSMNWALNNLK